MNSRTANVAARQQSTTGSFTAPRDGMAYVRATGWGGTYNVYINNVEVGGFTQFGADGHTEGRWFAGGFYLGKGQIISSNPTSTLIYFVPFS